MAQHGLRGFASDFAAAPASSSGPAPVASIYELRRYKLQLGYDTVPKFLELYGSGLPSKLAANAPGTELLSLLYTEVGELNEVIEVKTALLGAVDRTGL